MSSDRELTTEEREVSQDRVEAILGSLPDDERIVLWAWMHGDRRQEGGDGLGVRAAADGLGMLLTTFHRKLKNAIKHAQGAAARFYAESGEAPGQYADLLAGVEVPPDPTSPKVTDEMVLTIYRELNSVRKTADHLGLN